MCTRPRTSQGPETRWGPRNPSSSPLPAPPLPLTSTNTLLLAGGRAMPSIPTVGFRIEPCCSRIVLLRRCWLRVARDKGELGGVGLGDKESRPAGFGLGSVRQRRARRRWGREGRAAGGTVKRGRSSRRLGEEREEQPAAQGEREGPAR
ncbi:hypothetical protein SEVIR_9G309966v4 [Setaria viridis]